MAEMFSGIGANAQPHQVLPQAVAPKAVQWSFRFWLVALAAGLAETLLMVFTVAPSVSEASLFLTIRLVLTVVMGVVLLHMRRGKNWARFTLALVLGVIGTLSLVYGPIEWLSAGNSLRVLLQTIDLAFAVFALIRTVHIVAVLTALGLMFRPRANAYFRL